MNLTQQTFDFTPVVHQYENNAESQQILDNYRVHFTDQCAAIYPYLMRGGKLTSHTALLGIRHNGELVQIGHLPRRIADLKALNVRLSFNMVNSYKEWYISESDFAWNKENIG